jgi:pilus assembly protein CpaE
VTILLEADPLAVATLQPVLGSSPLVVTDETALGQALSSDSAHSVVVVGPHVAMETALEIAATERVARPHLSVVLVRSRVDSTVLRNALRAGIREVVKFDDVTALADACRDLEDLGRQLRSTSTVESRPRGEQPGQVVTVFSAKGGCGKTTLATNLAAALAREGKSACLIDLDLTFGDVAISLQLFPTHTIGDAVAIRRLDESAVRGLVTHHSDKLDALLAPVEPGVAENVSAALVGELIAVLKQLYDVVVIDTPAAFSDQALAAFDITDHFLLVATLDVPAIKNLKLTLEMLLLLGYPRERWHIVLNRADAKVGLSLEDVQKMLNLPIAVQIPSSRAVPASINRGVPLVLDAPGHAVSEAVRKLAKRLEPEATPVRGRRAVKSSRVPFRRERTATS